MDLKQRKRNKLDSTGLVQIPLECSCEILTTYLNVLSFPTPPCPFYTYHCASNQFCTVQFQLLYFIAVQSNQVCNLEAYSEIDYCAATNLSPRSETHSCKVAQLQCLSNSTGGQEPRHTDNDSSHVDHGDSKHTKHVRNLQAASHPSHSSVQNSGFQHDCEERWNLTLPRKQKEDYVLVK